MCFFLILNRVAMDPQSAVSSDLKSELMSFSPTVTLRLGRDSLKGKLLPSSFALNHHP
jgi:hypothetical protein